MWTLPAEGMGKAKEHALKALELDQNLAEAHASLALIKLLYEWDWVGATAEVEKALELNPGQVMTYAAAALRHAFLGDPRDAVTAARKAQELDPLSHRGHNRLGYYYTVAGDQEKAIEHFERALKLDPSYWAPWYNLGMIHCREGRATEGIPLVEKARGLAPDDPGIVGRLGYCYGVSGQQERALDLLRELEEWSTRSHVSPIAFMLVYLGLGDNEEALEQLEKAYELRQTSIPYALRIYPECEPLRSDPRFQDLLRRVGFPEE